MSLAEGVQGNHLVQPSNVLEVALTEVRKLKGKDVQTAQMVYRNQCNCKFLPSFYCKNNNKKHTTKPFSPPKKKETEQVNQ